MAALTEERFPVGPTSLYCLKGGSGHPMLVLHGVEGHEGWLEFHEALAAGATVYAPSHPGFGYTEQPDWLRTVRDMAVYYLWFLQDAGLGEVDLVGVGLGGWIAATMAVMDPSPLRRLVLIGAAGVKPEQGEIFDIFVTPWPDVVARAFHDPASSAEYQRLYANANLNEFGGVREAAKTMSIRLAYRPYMYDPSLSGMLGKVKTPTQIIWGSNDQIVPVECGQMYEQGIAGAQLHVLSNCGHWAHLERPAAIADIIHGREAAPL